MTTKKESRIIKILAIVVGMLLIFSIYSGYRMLTLQPGDKTVTTAGITVEKPQNNVVDVKVDDEGFLKITYTDGTVRDVDVS